VIQDKEDSIEVVTYDKAVYKATLIGKDETRDLALLLVPGSFDSIELAEKEDIQVGKKVIAIGNPLGLSFTVTEGIISGIDRVGPSGLAEYVQTDVSLNPGNSGGPLIDTQGKVVGINNFKIGGAEALGFSLASPVIKERVNAISNQTIIP
jgi:serine protease Do